MSPTARISSASRMSGCMLTAIEKARRTYMPLEKRFSGVSTNSSTSANDTTSCRRFWISAREMPCHIMPHLDVLAGRHVGLRGPRRAPAAAPPTRGRRRGLGWRRHARKHLQQRRLTGAVGADDSEDGAFFTEKETSFSAQTSRARFDSPAFPVNRADSCRRRRRPPAAIHLAEARNRDGIHGCGRLRSGRRPVLRRA